ncbi:cytochrome P450 [Microbacterium thalassium]|uniref:Cytochrome P450 n=1 Tax=Microbacterium thalassium TaxID=362649 RepID=A0A7X0FQM3_9MICO|nr:cytochrome P450 [Microbacterium thalassium]MBB6391914.1 cytochrome P450 [Microbacterium thalassium]GLK23934.1 cytochrome P450 [Microbacterium thalassium]
MANESAVPPGRLGLPWLGESAAILKDNHQFFRDRFDRYGPVFKTRLFGIDFAVFSGPEAFHRFATDPRIERIGAHPLPVAQMFDSSVAVTDGPHFRERKLSILDGVWRREAIAHYLPGMQAGLERMLDRWRAQPDVSVRESLSRFTAENTAAMYLVDPQPADVERLLRFLPAFSGAFTTLPIPLPWTQYGRAVRARRDLMALIDDTLDRHLAEPRDDALSRMIDSARSRGVDPRELRHDMVFLLFAGQSGLTVPLTFATMALGRNPEIMERARAEALAVAPDGDLTLDDLDRLEYLGAISKEVRRYYPMNASTNFGRVTAPMEVGGYRIPAGWGAIGAIHITMRNPDVFAEPDVFDPERFTPEREAKLAPGSYVPQGDGDRAGHRCPGEDMVTVATKLYLALALRRGVWSVPEQDLTLSREIFPMPRSGLRIRFEPQPPG